MNFLIITFDFPPTVGGIETRIKNYIVNLIKMGCKVKVIALASTHKSTFTEHFLGATVYRCPSSPTFIFNVFFSIRKELKRDPVKVIYVLTGANTLAGLLYVLYGKIKKLKTGVFVYGKDILGSKNNPLQFLLLRLSLILVDKIGVNSKATSHYLPKQTLHKVHVLYPGVDVQTISQHMVPRLGSENEKKILFVGRLIKRKGIADLLRAFNLVLENIPEASLVIVGDGPQNNALRNLSKTLGIYDRVNFAGTLIGKDLYAKYQESDVFVMPSKKISGDVEGFGIVFLEAGLFKKPSIGTWSGGIPEAVLHKQTGILVPEGDIIALKNAIELLLTNENLARKLGENAYNRIIKNFTWEKVTLKLLQMFQQ